MGTPRPTVVRRVPEYCGPATEIEPDGIDEYERRGGYVISSKIDGMWSCLTVYGAGDRHLLKSRDARTGPIEDSAAGDLLELPFPRELAGTKIIGELEAASQWATIQSEKQGFRRMHLFDVAYLKAEDVRHRRLDWRLELLANLYGELTQGDHVVASRLPLVQHYSDRFRARYDEWVARDLEGCVIKKADSTALPTKLDGKIHDWIRCKPWITAEFILVGLGSTAGGKTSVPALTGHWGLYNQGKLVKVMQAGAPLEFLREENVGKLVGEFKGWTRFKSGAIRHAQWIRERTDKAPEECLFEQVG